MSYHNFGSPYGSPAPGRYIFVENGQTPGGDGLSLNTGSRTGSHASAAQREQEFDSRMVLELTSDDAFLVHGSDFSHQFFLEVMDKAGGVEKLFVDVYNSTDAPVETRNEEATRITNYQAGLKASRKLATKYWNKAVIDKQPIDAKIAAAREFLSGAGPNGARAMELKLKYCLFAQDGYSKPLEPKYHADDKILDDFLVRGLDPQNRSLRQNPSMLTLNLETIAQRTSLSATTIDDMGHDKCGRFLDLFHKHELYRNQFYQQYVADSIHAGSLHRNFPINQIVFDGGLRIEQRRTILKICVGLLVVPAEGYKRFMPNRAAGSDGWEKSGRALLVDDILARELELARRFGDHWLDRLANLYSEYMGAVNEEIAKNGIDYTEICRTEILPKKLESVRRILALVREEFGSGGRIPAINMELPNREAVPQQPSNEAEA